jgi:hypothetical protein
MKAIAPLIALPALIPFLLAAAELKKLRIDATGWAPGEPPEQVFVVEGKVQISLKDGNPSIAVDPTAELAETCAQVGPSAAGAASIQARVFASKRARSVPRFGISVHGMSGHRLMVNAARKQLELVKGEQVVASAPLQWTSEQWMTLKIEAKPLATDQWQIEGSAWSDGQQASAVKVAAKAQGLKGQGKCSLWATPYSQTPVYFDDLELEIQTAAP